MGYHFSLLNFTEKLRMDDRARLRDYDNNGQNETLLAINDWSTTGYPIFAKVYLEKDYIQSELLKDGDYAAIKHSIKKEIQAFPPQAQLVITSSVYLVSTAKTDAEAENQVTKDAAFFLQGSPNVDSWLIRSYNTDNVSAMFLNGMIVNETRINSVPDSKFVPINPYWKKTGENFLSVATLNSGGPSTWGYTLRHNTTDLWDVSASGATNVGLVFQRILQVSQDGQIFNFQQPNPSELLPGQWEAVLKVNNGSGFLLVDHYPVGASTDNQEQRLNISNFLGQTDNILHWNVWSEGGAYEWQFSILKDNQVVWTNQVTADHSERGRVHHVQMIINKDGNIFPVMDFPVDYTGRSNGFLENFNLNFNSRTTSIFDHNMPNYEMAKNNGILRIYTGESIPNPGGVDFCTLFF